MVVYEFRDFHSFVKPNAKGSIFYYQSLTCGSPILTNASSFISDTAHDFLCFLEINCGNTMLTKS
jgi:hypothetical protein